MRPGQPRGCAREWRTNRKTTDLHKFTCPLPRESFFIVVKRTEKKDRQREKERERSCGPTATQRPYHGSPWCCS